MKKNDLKTFFYMPDDVSCDVRFDTIDDLTIADIIKVDNGIMLSGYAWDNWVIDTKGQIVPQSGLLRNSWNHNCPKTKKHIRYDVVNTEVVFLGGGYTFQHFGHFLIEGIGRWWALLYPQYKDKKVAIALKKKEKLPDFIYKMLVAYGVRAENIIVIRRNTKFKKLYIPSQSTIIGIGVSATTKKVYDTIADSLEDKTIKVYDKIFLSRGEMKDNRTFGEKQIENIFEKNGYKIIYPEKLPFEHQVTLVRNCKYLAGTAGSALHMAFFMKPGGTVVQLKRNSKSSDNSGVQQAINSVCALNSVFVYSSIEKYPTNHFTHVPQILGITPQLIDFFNDFGFVYSQSDIEFNKGEFNNYLRQLRKYKIKQGYAMMMQPFIRFVSLFGITRHGRQIIRNKLRFLLKADRQK